MDTADDFARVRGLRTHTCRVCGEVTADLARHASQSTQRHTDLLADLRATAAAQWPAEPAEPAQDTAAAADTAAEGRMATPESDTATTLDSESAETERERALEEARVEIDTLQAQEAMSRVIHGTTERLDEALRQLGESEEREKVLEIQAQESELRCALLEQQVAMLRVALDNQLP
eukprot:m51a1_g1333 hypothetical protein (176) ;mRNA; r:299020-299904